MSRAAKKAIRVVVWYVGTRWIGRGTRLGACEWFRKRLVREGRPIDQLLRFASLAPRESKTNPIPPIRVGSIWIVSRPLSRRLKM
jgi:hypothetical protein